MINPNTKVVPIDHGWANMKTEQDVFTSGVSEITTEPALFNDVLEYNNKYYKIGGKRLEVKEDKVHDDNYYLLTLAATAMTLERLHIRDAHVLWAVGLPLTRFGEEKDEFIQYLMRNKEVTFKYNKIKYHIVVEKVSVLNKKDNFQLDERKKIAKNYISDLMVLTTKEKEYLDRFEEKKYMPELLFEDAEIVERVKNHPMALWKCKE